MHGPLPFASAIFAAALALPASLPSPPSLDFGYGYGWTVAAQTDALNRVTRFDYEPRGYETKVGKSR